TPGAIASASHRGWLTASGLALTPKPGQPADTSRAHPDDRHDASQLATPLTEHPTPWRAHPGRDAEARQPKPSGVVPARRDTGRVRPRHGGVQKQECTPAVSAPTSAGR